MAATWGYNAAANWAPYGQQDTGQPAVQQKPTPPQHGLDQCAEAMIGVVAWSGATGHVAYATPPPSEVCPLGLGCHLRAPLAQGSPPGVVAGCLTTLLLSLSLYPAPFAPSPRAFSLAH